ncbi:proton-coupled folate transporter-like isoform X2 [Penaeus japonicus]|nr:proton-coupled folate transporter-like isoform X2 [Penaeus japonicus]
MALRKENDPPGGDTEEPPASTTASSSGCGRLAAWAATVSVEPVLFLHNLASQVVWVASQDLLVEKACLVNYGYAKDVCGDLTHHNEEQARVQDLVSEFLMYRSIFETSIKVIFVLYLGSWSDRTGRKIPLVISLLGLLGESAVFLANALSPSWGVSMALLSSVPYSLSGGTHALLMLAFAHLADTSGRRERTVRMGLLDAAYYLGSPVGLAVVSPLLDAGGYTAAFATSILIYCASAAYVLLRIRQTERQRQQQEEPQGTCDLSHLSEAVAVTCRPRHQRATTHILLLILAMLFDSMPVWGEGNVKYLFTQRALDWNHTQYSHWGTFSSLLSVAVLVVAVPVVSGVLGIRDGWMGVIGAVSRMVGSLCYAFVTSPDLAWLMWMGAAISSAKNLAPVSIRSLLSKLAGAQDVGKVYAVMATAESILPFAAAPMYNSLFTATNDTRPATYNFLSAGLYSGLLVIIL